MFRMKLDAAAILAASLVIGGSLVNLAREVSRLAVVVDGLGASVELERSERKEADQQLRDSSAAMHLRLERVERNSRE